MQVVAYTDPGAFLDRALPALLAQEAINGLLIGVVTRLQSQGPSQESAGPALLALVEDGDRLLAAAAMTPPQRLLLWAGDRDIGQSLAALVDDLRARRTALPGVVGPAPVARVFCERWQERSGALVVPRLQMEVYQLHQVRYRGAAAGHPRLAVAADEELLVAWSAGFHRDARVTPVPDEAQTRRSVAARTRAGDLLIWEDGALPVSVAGRGRPTPNGVAINFVYTPPEQRRRGYATACVAALSRRELDRGRRFCTLFADLANPTSNSIYRRIGYEPIGQFGEFDFAAAPPVAAEPIGALRH